MNRTRDGNARAVVALVSPSTLLPRRDQFNRRVALFAVEGPLGRPSIRDDMSRGVD